MIYCSFSNAAVALAIFIVGVGIGAGTKLELKYDKAHHGKDNSHMPTTYETINGMRIEKEMTVLLVDPGIPFDNGTPKHYLTSSQRLRYLIERFVSYSSLSSLIALLLGLHEQPS